MLKVILDSNVFISAVLTNGKPRDILRLVRDDKVAFFISAHITEEISRVLKEKIKLSNPDIRKVLERIDEITTMVFPEKRVDIIKIHKEDNRILECALAAQADYLISGDKKHILPLKEFKGIKVISPKEFLDIFLTKQKK